MPRVHDAIIVGLGAMGAAALWRSVRAGAAAVGIDRYMPPHAMGEHAGEQRMYRLSYFEHPDYVPLMRRALELWRGLPVDGDGPPHIVRTGAAYLGEPGGTLIAGVALAADRHRLAHEVLSGAARRSRLGLFEVPATYDAIIEDEAGYLVPELAIPRMLAHAELESIIDHREVREWRERAGVFEVFTQDSLVRARALCLAAGPWMRALAPELDLPLRVTRQVQAWITLTDDQLEIARAMPCFAIELPGRAPALFYGFPPRDGQAEMKVAIHAPGEATDPARVDRTVTDADLRPILAAVEAHLPSLAGPVSRASVCLYTNSPDGHFIIDRHPRHPRAVILAGFSGHGFKFAPAIGEMAHAMMADPDLAQPSPFLSLARLASVGA